MEEKKDNQAFYVPGAIIVGALIIAGAIIYALNPPQKKEVTFIQEVAQQLGVEKNQFNSCLSENKYKSKIDQNQALGLKQGVHGTPSGFVNGQQFFGALLYDQRIDASTPSLKELIDNELNGKKTSVPADIEITPQDHIRGNSNAPVTIVEFSDLQCPFCQRFHSTMKQALDEYGDKVRWVYKHFPLTQIHQFAFGAAEASECVWEQKGNDAFWKFTDTIFSNQGRLGSAI